MGDILRNKLDLDAVSVKPLDPAMGRAAFCCGNKPIDNFFKNNSKTQHNQHRVRVYVASVNQEPIGYYYLVAKSSLPAEVCEEATIKFGRVNSVPTIYLGMIGVDQKYQANGLGRFLMLHAMRQTLAVADLVGLYALTLDAIDEETACRYERWGFTRFVAGDLAMFIALQTIKTLFKVN